MTEKQAMLSTVDNPWNPFTNFDEWYAFDVGHGYHSCAVLDRFARTSDALSDADNSLEISNAIDEIIKFDPFHRFIKVLQD
jgi:hypothetical protein